MRRRAALLLPVVLAVALGASPSTLARFTDADATAASIGTGALAPPTALAASGGTTVSLAWTPSTSTAASGYDLLRSATQGAGYAFVKAVVPVTLGATSDNPAAGTWYYVLQTRLQSWTSAISNEAAATVVTGSTGYQGCASNAADTGGDGDGYQTAPGNGCAVDGAVARDTGSGTNTTVSCTDAGKDRHRFWGYAFGLPPAVTSIDGFDVRIDMGLNNNGGTSLVCAQLSWDGGTTWTAARSVALTSVGVATYALGGTADAWGRAWTAAELDPATFRVRLIDVSSQSSKEFRLDGVSVRVSYTP